MILVKNLKAHHAALYFVLATTGGIGVCCLAHFFGQEAAITAFSALMADSFGALSHAVLRSLEQA